VTADGASDLCVTDRNDRVLELAAGATAQTVLPFTGLKNPLGVAVDGAGDIHVTDFGNSRVLKVPAG